ncbi:MAG: dihydroxy-acid dehydratase, partial [Pseudomonadota bacterium]
MTREPKRPFRSREWFHDSHRPDMAAIYIERYTNNGYTYDELRSGKPIIGIAQTGSDLSPCNKIHQNLA